MTKLLVFSGSGRKDSWNRKVAQVVAKGAQDAGATIKVINLTDYNLPIYDQDLEEASGLPEGAIALKALFDEHDGFIVASPEYNGAPSALLKNAIDWISRPYKNEARLQQFTGKTAAIIAASPGSLGGIRGLPILNTILSGLGTMIVPPLLAVPKVHEKFEGDTMTDEGTKAQLIGLGEALVRASRSK